MRPWVATRHLTSENPLFRGYLRTANAYSWKNFLLTMAVTAVALASIVRFQAWRLGHRLVAALPESLQASEKELLFDERDESSPSVVEFFAFALQSAGFAILLGIMFLSVFAAVFRSRRIALQVSSEEIQVLPLTFRQIVFGLWDWPVIKILLLILLGMSLTLLPSRITKPPHIVRYLHPKSLGYEQWLVQKHLGQTLFWVSWALPRAVFLWALHRTILRVRFTKWETLRSKCCAGWVLWLVILLLRVRLPNLPVTYWDTRLEALYPALAPASVAMLLVFCLAVPSNSPPTATSSR